MLQMYTNRIKNTYRLFDLQGTIMPTAMHAEGLICVRLHKDRIKWMSGTESLCASHGITR